MAKVRIVFVWTVLACSLAAAFGEQCGSQADGTLCPNDLCCSEYGWCGNTDEYCCHGCQSQCSCTPPPPPPPPPPTPPPPPPPPTPSGEGVSSIITENIFEEMLKHRNNQACPARNFYTYDAFITAADSFPNFGTTGNLTTMKQELAAFFGQTSHETTGGWATAEDGPYAWGYCYVNEIAGGDYCDTTNQVPCAAGKQYYGRGPIQLSWQYNYDAAGKALGVDLLNNPDLVATDPVISFKTAIWFWMTEQPPKPSCHDVMTDQWTPSESDVAAGRLPGYGMTTNIINGGLECGYGSNDNVEDRIGFYETYCDMLGVSYGPNLDCYNMTPYGLALTRSGKAQLFSTAV